MVRGSSVKGGGKEKDKIRGTKEWNGRLKMSKKPIKCWDDMKTRKKTKKEKDKNRENRSMNEGKIRQKSHTKKERKKAPSMFKTY